MLRHLFLFIAGLSICGAEVELGQVSPFGDAAIPVEDAPTVTEWREADTEGKVNSRTETALLAGPDALEKLGQSLLAEESKDGDGRYTMPLFYLTLGNSGENVRGQDRLDYQLKTVGEWRKKYPESLVAMVAEARVYNRWALNVILDSGNITSMEKQFEEVNRICHQALELLEKSKTLAKQDPGWHVTYVSTLRMMEKDQPRLEAAVDEILATFPDSGYAISRAVKNMQPELGVGGRIWEKWLRKKLEVLPPDVAAKAYARTISELVIEQTTERAIWGVTIDRGMMHRGLDALAAEYPQSIGVAAEEAKLAAFVLTEPPRIRAALRRAGGKIDQMVIRKDQYPGITRRMASIQWKPERLGIPEVVGFTMGEPEGFGERMEKAVAAGPRGLEELIQHLRSHEVQDKDGRYPSCAFFAWFKTDVNRLPDLTKAMKKQKLLEEWLKEYPASPFANLAFSYHWVGRAWDARGGSYAGTVKESQWKGFHEGLKKAADHLEAAGELRKNEPAWMVSAMEILLGTEGGGLNSGGYEKLINPMIENFPECVECLGKLIYASTPKWGGKAGEWEPLLRQKLKDAPEDVRARTYALAVASIETYAIDGVGNWPETYGKLMPDRALLQKGVDLLVAKYPDSQYVANVEAVIFSKRIEDPVRACAALKRMNGVIDLGLWREYGVYSHCVRWVASKAKK